LKAEMRTLASDEQRLDWLKRFIPEFEKFLKLPSTGFQPDPKDPTMLVFMDDARQVEIKHKVLPPKLRIAPEGE
jgi:hypothetical protein